MKPCKECGRVNPSEATYCMTCGASLTEEGQREQTDSSSRPTYTYDSRIERLKPVVEDFAFDVARAGAKLYFGMKDPEGAVDPVQRARSSRRSRYERLKDILAEARVEHLRRDDDGPNRNRNGR